MQKTLLLLAGLAICAAAAPAKAQHIYIGPGYGGYGGYERPYYEPRYYGDGYRRYGRGDLSYYCGFGSQTPRSARRACIERGYW
jgi:hypothetical protein